MGFGHGPWGHFPFGDNDWATDVLYNLVPVIYRDDDPDELLSAWASALGPSFTRLRLLIRDLKNQRDPFKVQTVYDKTATLRLGSVVSLLSEIEQTGNNATVSSLGYFSAPNARFDASSIGKQLTLSRSSVPGNNRSAIIIAILSPTTVTTSPSLLQDAGPTKWALRSVLPSVPGQTTIEVQSGDVSSIYPSWTLSDGIATYNLVARKQIHPALEERKYLVEQEGTDGTVVGGALVAPSIVLTFRDVGKKLSISGSAVTANNGRFEITGVAGSTITLSQALTTDAGPLYWAVWPREELTLEVSGNAVPHGVIEQYGENLTIAGPSTVSSPTANFLSTDVGNLLTIKGSTLGNNGTYTIASVVSPTQATVSATLTNETPVYWEVREPTTIGDFTQVQCNCPSLIDLLAQDYGITVDTQEVEHRQRTWVASVNQWANMKGVPDSYEFLGKISGFNVSTAPMYRINIDRLPLFAGRIRVITTVDSGTGRSGSDGSLTLSGGQVRLSSPTALFRPGDTNFQVRIQGSGSGNNAVYTVSDYIDANTLQFRPADTATTPDANNGALTWTLIRYYGTESVGDVLYDEINSDLLTTLVGASHFTVDKRCWENDFLAEVAVNISAVTSIGPGEFQVTVAGANTTITAASDSVALPTGTINVASTAGFTDYVAGGQIKVLTSAGLQLVNYTGTTGTTFTGCTGGTGTMSTGGSVTNAAPEVVVGVGNWQIIDSNGAALYLSTVPTIVGTGPSYTFNVESLAAPATGNGFLNYDCPASNIDCNYCKSNKVLVTISPGDIVNDPVGPATEHAINNRLLDRLKEVTPIHVQPVFMISYVYDDYIRPNQSPVVGPTIGGAYNLFSGSWSIVNNQLTPGGVGNESLVSNSAQSDATWELRFGNAASTEIGGLIFRAGSTGLSGNYWLLEYDGTANLLRLKKTGPTTVASTAMTSAPGDVLTVVTSGPSIQVYLNGIHLPALDTTDTFAQTGTYVGISSTTTATAWTLLRVKPSGTF